MNTINVTCARWKHDWELTIDDEQEVSTRVGTL